MKLFAKPITLLLFVVAISGCQKAELPLSLIAPVLTDFTIPAKNVGDAPFAITPPKSTSAAPYIYSSSNTAVATVTGNTLTVVGVGQSTITARQAATGNYETGQITATLTVTPANTVIDVDGNVYATVTIGGQTWLAGNLKTTHYRDGTSIDNVTTDAVWNALRTAAYCYFNNDAATPAIYGKLYNWYAVTNTHQLAPEGWHVATDAEWTTLYNYIGGTRYDAGKLMETGTTHWSTEITATNSTGFTAVPAGYRNYLGLTRFNGVGLHGIWWSATQSDATKAWAVDVYVKGYIERVEDDKTTGFSVRCVKD